MYKLYEFLRNSKVINCVKGHTANKQMFSIIFLLKLITDNIIYLFVMFNFTNFCTYFRIEYILGH